jgi:hypothetical protein
MRIFFARRSLEINVVKLSHAIAYKYFIETLKTLRTLKSLRLIGNSPEMA